MALGFKKNSCDIVVINTDFIGSTDILQTKGVEYLADITARFHSIALDLTQNNFYQFVYLHAIIGDAFIFVINADWVEPSNHSLGCTQVELCTIVSLQFIFDLIHRTRHFIQFRTGISYGSIFFGTIRTIRTLFGFPLNMSTRLESKCNENEVNICSNLYDKLLVELAFFSLSEVHHKFIRNTAVLKGFGETVYYSIKVGDDPFLPFNYPIGRAVAHVIAVGTGVDTEITENTVVGLKRQQIIITRMWPDAVKKVYVLCHPVKEKARYERLMPHLAAVGIPADRIQICAPTWGADLTVEQIFAAYNPYLKRGVPTFTFKGASLSRGEISLGLNFAAAVAAATKEEGLIMTLESDVWLREDFVPRLVALLESATSPWDYIGLGEGMATRPPGAPVSYYAPSVAYEPPHKWVFRCTDSMLFTSDYMKRLNRTFVPFREIIDWEMNYQLMLHQGKALWADPPLAEQGTCNSRLVTSLPA